ncbi:hypothetical protein UFOVP177_37 [uncultured Caudovirales phage]|jgi:hypothetical protein|uniref:Uncharacterized protein n=1 Tax=uncultured Caudovirales phage TaxID=2100421 RepID=A0A6J7WIK2_9CAUD|nr:hypothetical protein UFOVP177_37 [uncultured Caudovirales phage]
MYGISIDGQDFWFEAEEVELMEMDEDGIVWKYDREAAVWMYFDEDADEWLLYDENNFDPFTRSLFRQPDSTLPSTASNQHEPEQQQASNVIALPLQQLL